MNELRLTLKWVAEAVGGRMLSGDPDQNIGQVTTDSRTLGHGDFFVALKGPRFDGHEYLGEVIAKGGRGAIVEPNGGNKKADAERSQGFALIEVADTTKALQDLAHAVRKASGTKVVAITGSAGKTTTKETIAQLLAARFRVVKNKGNLNNHIGLPLSLMQLRERPDVAVMELGMNHAGEISTLVAIAEPEVRVWTNVGDAHIGFFRSADEIAEAKAEILERAEPNHLLVCNADDPRVMSHASRFPGRRLTFGTVAGAMVRATGIEDLGLEGMRAKVSTPAGVFSLQTALLGRGNLANTLAAAAVGIEFNVDLSDIASAIAKMNAAERRGAVRRLANGITLIDDSYNSSPTALKRTLEVLANESRAQRKVAVLGEMLELGEHSTSLHRESGEFAAKAGVDLLCAIGGEPARALAEAAVKAGMSATAVHHFDNSEAAAAAIAAVIRPGDVILVKGSRGTRADIVTDRIVAEHG